jgi:hypothetical protein
MSRVLLASGEIVHTVGNDVGVKQRPVASQYPQKNFKSQSNGDCLQFFLGVIICRGSLGSDVDILPSRLGLSLAHLHLKRSHLRLLQVPRNIKFGLRFRFSIHRFIKLSKTVMN